jgi:catechol 2,3-dioxygenase-like lactoylglutathione lyase family enzyme
MLTDEKLVGFLATADPEAARAFYEGVLGLPFAGDHGPLLAFDWGRGRLMLQKIDKVTPPHGTALGWNVADLRAAVRALAERGVAFERYDSMQQDELQIWSPVPGEGVAWFKDPDGNLLSLNGPI